MSAQQTGAVDDPYDVIPYTTDEIAKIVAARAWSALTEEEFRQRSHYYYFHGYFNDLSASTIVVEHDYIDRDYLEDYAGYYVRCFPRYARHCKRLHFFDIEFGAETFKALLAGKQSALTPADLQKGYLGFIVIKPLPKTVIGRTCLRTYRDQPRRHYPVSRVYDVNLFGIPLQVESLAFQEQDEVVSACATSALWSLFQSTGIKFQHAIPTPLEITRSAARQMPTRARVLPNSGLQKTEMCHAIQEVGLEPEVVGIGDNQIREDLLRANVYAYLRGGIPVLLCTEVYDVTEKVAEQCPDHVVTVTGFSLGKTTPQQYSHPESQINLVAFRMDKLYVHDDQVGPYARVEFDDRKVEIVDDDGQTIDSLPSLLSPSIGSGGRTGVFRAVPMVLLAPLYHKIRIPFHAVFNVLNSVDTVLRSLADNVRFPNDQAPEWDIYLTTVNDFKTSVMAHDGVAGDYGHSVLTQEYPRFLWRCSARAGDNLLFDLLFDATDIEQANYFHGAVVYDELTKLYLQSVLSIPDLDSVYRGQDSEPVFDALKRTL